MAKIDIEDLGKRSCCLYTRRALLSSVECFATKRYVVLWQVAHIGRSKTKTIWKTNQLGKQLWSFSFLWWISFFFKKSCLMCKLSATIEPGCRLWNPTNLILSCIYNGIEAKVEDLQRIKLSQHSLSNFPNPPSVRPSVAFKEGLFQCMLLSCISTG